MEASRPLRSQGRDRRQKRSTIERAPREGAQVSRTETIAHVQGGLMPRWKIWLPVLFLVGLGLAVRLSDLTDPPLDFHPTRQLRGLLVARYLYFRWDPRAGTPEQRTAAVQAYARMGRYEPPVLESLTAATYLLLGREVPWLARVYSSLFWMVGALAVFGLARRAAPETPAAAWAALAVLAVHPFAVRASRAIQPDPLMTAALAGGAWAWERWLYAPSWRRAALATTLVALAAWIKVFALPIALALTAAAWLAHAGRRAPTRAAFWGWLTLTATPALLFYLGWRGETVGHYGRGWIWDLHALWWSKRLYANWGRLLTEIYGGGWLCAAGLGWLLLPSRTRSLATAWLAGYAAYGFLLPYQMMSHSYYHLPLFPWLAWGLTPVVAHSLRGLPHPRPGWIRGALVGLALLAVFFAAGDVYDHLRDNDYHQQAARWQKIGPQLPAAPCVGLVEFYGYGLAYYGGHDVVPWPSSGDRALARLRGRPAEQAEAVRAQLQDYTCFVVTNPREWERRPALQAALQNYPRRSLQEDAWVFDLQP